MIIKKYNSFENMIYRQDLLYEFDYNDLEINIIWHKRLFFQNNQSIFNMKSFLKSWKL